MDTRTCAALLLLLLLASSALAQDAFTQWALKDMQWRIESIVKLLLCAIWAITAATLTIVVIISGIRYLTSQDADEKDKARKNIKQGFVGLMIIVAACPFVNYLVHGTDVAEFRCDCIPLPPPTTTTTTTTTIPVGAPGTRPTTTTSTTTTMTVTTYPKTGQGRFLLVGNNKYPSKPGMPIPNPYNLNDIYGVIFNMDGSIHKQPFYIDNNPGPIALAVGNNRFFVAYGSSAVVLDWEGNTMSRFQTMEGYMPVKAVQANGLFYVLLTPATGDGSCYINVYSLDGALQKEHKTEIDGIESSPLEYYGNQNLQGDMALGGGKLFIVWSDLGENQVNAIAYDLSGKKVKDKFTMAVPQEPINESNPYGFCSLSFIYNATNPSGGSYISLINPQTEAGSSNFIVMANGGKMFLYDINTLQLKGEKSFDFPSSTPGYGENSKCIHDIAYGDGKFLAVYYNEAKYYDDSGNQVGSGQFGGHGDCPTHLAYGNKMFVGVVAIHMTGDGIGASFLDSNGNHLIDVMPLEMPESPGWAAYDW